MPLSIVTSRWATGSSALVRSTFTSISVSGRPTDPSTTPMPQRVRPGSIPSTRIWALPSEHLFGEHANRDLPPAGVRHAGRVASPCNAGLPTLPGCCNTLGTAGNTAFAGATGGPALHPQPPIGGPSSIHRSIWCAGGGPLPAQGVGMLVALAPRGSPVTGLITRSTALEPGYDDRDLRRLVRPAPGSGCGAGCTSSGDRWAELDPFRGQPLLRVRAARLVRSLPRLRLQPRLRGPRSGMGAPDPARAQVHVTRRKVHGDADRAGVKHHLAPYATRPGRVRRRPARAGSGPHRPWTWRASTAWSPVSPAAMPRSVWDVPRPTSRAPRPCGAGPRAP